MSPLLMLATILVLTNNVSSLRIFTQDELATISIHPIVSATSSLSPSASTTHLNYYCGPVLTGNVSFYPFFYTPDISVAFKTNVTTFLADIGSTPWANVVSEYYNKSGKYILGKWNFAQALTGTGASCTSSSCPITDAQIQSILLATYQTKFPSTTCPSSNIHILFYAWKGYSINQVGSYSCQQFCGYHGAINTGNAACPTFTYSVYPYLGTDGPCGFVCGPSISINNMFSVMSHEIAETVTNPDVSFATTYGPPLAWYDSNNGEIGDICNGMQATTTATNGKLYTVQKLWSNKLNLCTSTPYYTHLPPPAISPPNC